MTVNWQNLIDGVKKGNVRALARTITRVENREEGWQTAMRDLFPETGRARVFGITGSPGAGKSTLTKEIAGLLLKKGCSVGIIAVDPSSPFSGGALLGDRLRMKSLYEHPDVFIRSMATRGMMGGLCQAARDVTRILDAFGKDIILIETVGVGQDEIEIVRASDAVMVVCVPGQGDGVQAIKAGIMEIADLFVVNKADRDGVDELVADIGAMLELSSQADGGRPPVLKTSALNSQGIEELVDIILSLDTDKTAFVKQQIKEEVLGLVESELSRRLRSRIGRNGLADRVVEDIVSRKSDPYTVVEEILSRFEKDEINTKR